MSIGIAVTSVAAVGAPVRYCSWGPARRRCGYRAAA